MILILTKNTKYFNSIRLLLIFTNQSLFVFALLQTFVNQASFVFASLRTIVKQSLQLNDVNYLVINFCNYDYNN